MPVKYGKSTVKDKTNWKCRHCNDIINEETDNSIECAKCSSWYHVECTLLDRKNFMDVVKYNRIWFCHLCPENDKNSNESNSFEKAPAISNSENLIMHDSPKCIRCFTVLLNSTYQEIFSETGKELGLQTLLSQCFDIDIKEDKNEVQALCDECVNELIETYDLMQSENLIEKVIIDEKDIKMEILSSEDEYIDKDTSDNDDDDEEDDDDEDDDNGVENINDNTNNEINFSEDTSTDNVKSISDDNDENNEFETFYLDDFDEEFDFKAYKEKVIKNHKFNEILFTEPIKCRLCSEELYDHVKILEHIKQIHVNTNGGKTSYPCVIDETCTPLDLFEDFSFHLIFKHYDLQNLVILTECPECNQFFENFLEYNKHCCDTVKRFGRRDVECEQCGKIFKSNKRYRFHLQFHLEKRRPKACFICDTMFRDEDEFYDHIKYDHDKNIGNVCKICDLVFSSEENLKNHTEISHNKEHIYYNCTVCMKPFSTLQHLKQHMIIHEDTKYKCDVCGKYLTRKSRLNKHLIRHQKPVETEVMCCSICGFVSRNDNDAESHLHKHDERHASVEIESISIAYTCEYCDESFNTIENLFNHREQHPPDDFVCNICNIKYTKYSVISSHRASHTKCLESNNEFPVMKYFVCGISGCKKSYPLWTTLNMHRMKNHQSRNSLILNCPKCNLNFTNNFEYRKHLSENHKGKLIFDCSFCNKSFRTKSALKLHVKRLHKERQEEQMKTKIKKKKTKAEKAMLPKEKKFICKICGKGFYNKSDVTVHEKAVHNKEAKYFCSECPFKTPYKQTLVYHTLTHKDEYPYQCSICSRKFRFKNSHKLHEQRHQNFRNFTCNIDGCNMSYINLGRLKTHQKLKHGPNAKYMKTTRKHLIGFDTYSDTFIDDDDGLDDGVIGESLNSSQIQTISQESQNQQQQQQHHQHQYQQQNTSSELATSNIPVENFIVTKNIEVKNVKIYTNNIQNVKNEYTVKGINDIMENDKKPVLIIRNNDYIMQLDHTKIYGNALEVTDVQETEIGATEIIGE